MIWWRAELLPVPGTMSVTMTMTMVAPGFDLQHPLEERELFDQVNRKALFSCGDLF